MKICNYGSMQVCKLQANLWHILGKSHGYLMHISGRYQANSAIYQANLSQILDISWEKFGQISEYLRYFCIFVYIPQSSLLSQ